MIGSAPRQWARRAARAVVRRRRTANGPALRTAIPTDHDSGPIDLLAAGLPAIDWAGRDVERPSYRHKLHESKRRKLLLDAEGHRQRVWAFNDKLAGLQLATDLGVATPTAIADVSVVDDLDWDKLPERFVLKPFQGAASRATFLLCRTGAGFRDLMDGGFKSQDDIVGAARDLVDRGLVSARFCVEELLSPRTELLDRIAQPDDFKVFCFWDRPIVVMQRRLGGRPDQSAWRFKFWNSAWEDLGPVKYPDRCDPTLEAPAGGEEIVEAAARIGRQLAIPFVRLDFYDTDRGAVFGEVTPHPGPPERWDPKVDEILGRQWEHAEVRLLAAGIAPNEPKP
ncbi:MAG: ATP-grasp fold amidoligase family protein [Acidimicrobiales bacterium]